MIPETIQLRRDHDRFEVRRRLLGILGMLDSRLSAEPNNEECKRLRAVVDDATLKVGLAQKYHRTEYCEEPSRLIPSYRRYVTNNGHAASCTCGDSECSHRLRILEQWDGVNYEKAGS